MNIGFLLIYCEGISTIHYWNSKPSNRISSQPGFGDYQLSKKPCSINDKCGNMKKNTSTLGITARYNVRDNRFTRSQADGLFFCLAGYFFGIQDWSQFTATIEMVSAFQKLFQKLIGGSFSCCFINIWNDINSECGWGIVKPPREDDANNLND